MDILEVSMTIEQMRKYVADSYPNSENWQKKAKSMPPNQVIAIYNSLRARVSSPNRKIKKNENTQKPKEEYHQITLFEVFGKKTLY